MVVKVMGIAMGKARGNFVGKPMGIAMSNLWEIVRSWETHKKSQEKSREK